MPRRGLICVLLWTKVSGRTMEGGNPGYFIECKVSNEDLSCEGDVLPGYANKKRFMQDMLRTSARTLKEMSIAVPDCVLRINLASGGSHSAQDLCIARSVKRMRCTMVPNPYFGDLYEWESRQLRLMKRNVPWEEKQDKVFYRGRCARHSRARFKIIDIDHPTLDVGWIRKGLTSDCLVPYTNESSTVAAHLAKSGRPYTEEYFSSFKFLVRLPGSTGASYSRHLNYLWNKGSIVLLWESEAEEWYYKWLEENKTHLVVNEANIVQKIEECLQLPLERQLELVAEAQGVFNKYLTRRALSLEWYKIMLMKAGT